MRLGHIHGRGRRAVPPQNAYTGRFRAARPHQAARHTPDRRIFQTARGSLLQDSGHNEVWTEARKNAPTPAQYRSPLGRRPYDLHHAAVSLWLNSGVPATEVARRAGHGVAVLLKIYAHWIDGQATAANQRIADTPGIQDAEETSGTRATATTSRHLEMAGLPVNSQTDISAKLLK